VNGSFKEILKAQGFRSTKERDRILQELETRTDHFNAEKLHASLLQKGSGVSRPTIYRTLSLLESLHCLEKLYLKKNCYFYEPLSQKKEHGHLICRRCGRITDFRVDGFDILKSEMDRNTDFKPNKISIQVFGLCGACQAEGKHRNERW
jgi:Fur family transcriptional regulator, ferric uptake regulator